MYLELDEDDLTEEVRALLPPPSSTTTHPRRSTPSFAATSNSNGVNDRSFPPTRSNGLVIGGRRVVMGSGSCATDVVTHHRHTTTTYLQYPYPMVESISMAYYSDEEGEGSPKSQSPPPPALTPPRSSSPPLTEYSPPDACVILPPPPPTTTTRTHAADRLNTISNRFCAVASEGVGGGRLGCTALISSLAVAPARHAVLTYADLRKELYSRMEYNNDTKNDAGKKEEEEVRVSAPPLPGTQSSCSSPSPHRGGGLPPYPWQQPIPLGGGGGVQHSSMLLRYQPPPSNRHPNNRKREVPIKAPSSSSTAGIYRSASEASPSFQVVDEGARPTHRLPSLPSHTVLDDTSSNKAKAAPNSVRLLGGSSSRCQGTKAGPTPETAAARTLFAMLVAEDERTGAVLRSEASAAAATPLSSLL